MAAMRILTDKKLDNPLLHLAILRLRVFCADDLSLELVLLCGSSLP